MKLDMKLDSQLQLGRCPHCGIDSPSLQIIHQIETQDYKDENKRAWRFYQCSRCGGVITASASSFGYAVTEIYPSVEELDDAIPERAKAYLEQARNSLNAPAGAIMLSASSIDAMLKEINLKEGSLYKRIDQARNHGTITASMAEWAHEIRLEANDQRHADEDADLPNENDARHVIQFAEALAQFLFIFPARVKRGINNAKSDD